MKITRTVELTAEEASVLSRFARTCNEEDLDIDDIEAILWCTVECIEHVHTDSCARGFDIVIK